MCTGKLLIVALLKNNFPLYSELIICPQLHTLKVNEPLNKLLPLKKDIKLYPFQCPCLFRGLPVIQTPNHCIFGSYLKGSVVYTNKEGVNHVSQGRVVGRF